MAQKGTTLGYIHRCTGPANVVGEALIAAVLTVASSFAAVAGLGVALVVRAEQVFGRVFAGEAWAADTASTAGDWGTVMDWGLQTAVRKGVRWVVEG